MACPSAELSPVSDNDTPNVTGPVWVVLLLLLFCAQALSPAKTMMILSTSGKTFIFPRNTIERVIKVSLLLLSRKIILERLMCRPALFLVHYKQTKISIVQQLAKNNSVYDRRVGILYIPSTTLLHCTRNRCASQDLIASISREKRDIWRKSVDRW